jgi:tripartite-type tricarboxylate transporter receptor subunit TctC
MINAASLLGNPFVASRQVPAERIKTLRAAFAATVADSAFIAEVESLRMQVDAKSGEQAAKLAADIYKAATPDLVAKAKDVLK